MPKMSVAGLFAGIGGLELGLSRSGHKTRMLCEIDGPACAVMAARMPGVPIHLGNLRMLGMAVPYTVTLTTVSAVLVYQFVASHG